MIVPPNGGNRRSTAFPLVPSRGGSKRQNGRERTTTDVSWWKEDSTEDSSGQDVQYCQVTAGWSRLFWVAKTVVTHDKIQNGRDSRCVY